MQFQLPVLLKGYLVLELNVYVKFTKIYVTRRNRIIRLELYKDDVLKNRIYDYTLERKIENNLFTYTFLPTDNKDERRRVPFYFADTIEQALAIAASKKYNRKVDLVFVNPVEFIHCWSSDKQTASGFSNCNIERNGDVYYINPSWYNVDITVDPGNVKKLTVGTYTWER